MRLVLVPDPEDLLIVREWLALKKGSSGVVPLDLSTRDAINALMAAWWADTVLLLQGELESLGIRWLPQQPGVIASEWVRQQVVKKT